MSAPVGAAAARAAAEATRWTTPRILRAFMVAIAVGALLIFIVGEVTLYRARSAIDTIGRQTAPSILAAQEVAAAFADLDANLANYLLLTDANEADAATQLFEFRRAQATKRLVDAAKNVTFGEGERVPVVLMFENLGRYLEAATRARYLHDKGDAAGALDAYRIATDIMHARILPDAQALDDANRAVMDGEYDRAQTNNAGVEGIAIFMALLLGAALLGAQVFLLRRMRRMLNVPLLVATVLTVVFAGYLVDRFGAAREDLRIAKEDAFDSLHVLWKARARAYDANGDESRWVLDRAQAGRWDDSFEKNVDALTTAPTFPPNIESQSHGTNKVSFGGLFAQELDNVAFVGERDAAIAIARGFAKYYAQDRLVRDAEKKGDHAGAVRLALHDANAAFDEFDAAALRTIDINEDVFDVVVDDADRGLALAQKLNPALALLVALAGWLGLRARLREYTSF